MSDHTPVTKEGLSQFDTLDAAVAVAKAWGNPGRHPAWHFRMQQIIRTQMPVLARALDRLVEENK